MSSSGDKAYRDRQKANDDADNPDSRKGRLFDRILPRPRTRTPEPPAETFDDALKRETKNGKRGRLV